MILLLIIVALITALSYYLHVLVDVTYLIPVWILSSILVVVLLSLLFTAFILIPIFNKLSYTNRFKHAFLKQILILVAFFSRMSYKVEGKENIVKDKSIPLVLVSNHKSLLDPVLHYLMMKRPMSAAAKSTLGKVPFFNKAIEAYQGLLINRSSDREAAKSIIQGAKYVEAGLPLIIYPEGGIRTRDTEQMVELRAGAYKLATRSKATIQIVATHNSTHPSKRRTFFSWTTVTLKVLEPMSYEEYKDLSTIELGLEIAKRVNATFPGEQITVSIE